MDIIITYAACLVATVAPAYIVEATVRGRDMLHVAVIMSDR